MMSHVLADVAIFFNAVGNSLQEKYFYILQLNGLKRRQHFTVTHWVPERLLIASGCYLGFQLFPLVVNLQGWMLLFLSLPLIHFESSSMLPRKITVPFPYLILLV